MDDKHMELESKSLKDWWNLFMDHKVKPKLRYVGWDHKVKYFTPLKFNKADERVEGHLDCGEVISFPVESQFWVNYEEGMEDSAKAV